MQKLLYIPEYSKLSDSNLEALKAICVDNHLQLMICVPIVYPVQWLIVDENPEKTVEPYISQWKDKLQALDLLGAEVSFELVYSYHAFLQLQLKEDDTSFVYADRRSSVLHFVCRYRQKMLSRNALRLVIDERAVLI